MTAKKVKIEDFLCGNLSIDQLEEIKCFAEKYAKAKDMLTNYSFEAIGKRHGVKAGTVRTHHYKKNNCISESLRIDLKERDRIMAIKKDSCPSLVFKRKKYNVCLSTIEKIYRRSELSPRKPGEYRSRDGLITIDADDIEIIKIFQREYADAREQLKDLTFEKISDRSGLSVKEVKKYYLRKIGPPDLIKRRSLLEQKRLCSPSNLSRKYEVSVNVMLNLYNTLAALP